MVLTTMIFKDAKPKKKKSPIYVKSTTKFEVRIAATHPEKRGK